jgi:hypothetical protein
MDKLLYKGYLVLDNLKEFRESRRRERTTTSSSKERRLKMKARKQNKVKTSKLQDLGSEERTKCLRSKFSMNIFPKGIFDRRGNGVLPKGQLSKKISIRSTTTSLAARKTE